MLWDESFLWGVMAHKALEANGLWYDLIRAEDVKNGRLKEYALLFVPGGWASNKLKALGDDGVREIKKFVHDGGSYLGFCGGAGLATLGNIGLVRVKRKPTKDRVPSFSGRIGLNITDHPLWDGLENSERVFHAWWPSQFVVEDENAAVLATYGEAMPDSFSSDVNVGDAEAGKRWPELERIYEINLDPKRLLCDPAVIEGAFGKGKVILSLMHFDTPEDPNGAIALKNLWKYLVPHAEFRLRNAPDEVFRGQAPCGMRNGGTLNAEPRTPDSEIILELETAVSSLIELGARNFLWSWRNPLLLQWRRGVRGLEYCTLFIMTKELVEIQRRQKTEGRGQRIDKDLEHIRALLLPFVDKAKRLLLLERSALQNGHITYERCDDPEIQRLREELFSRSKSYGGSFKTLIDAIDGLVFSVITRYKKRGRNDTA